ncbi:MAG: DMT family transporter [Defluviitaleaceae bacterium]|nr:DMT family transporter [Defluviitaleaceae bacterium]
MKGLKYNYYLFAITSILIWSLGFVTTRLALEYMHPFSIALVRYIVASVLLLGIALRFKIRPPERGDWPLFLFCGMAGHVIYLLLFKIASVTVTASTNAIIVATGPILIAVLAWVIYKEKLKMVQTFAFVLAFSGILVMTLVSGSLDTNIGVVLMFIGTVALAGFNLMSRKLLRKYSSLQVTVYTIFIGTAALTPLASYAVYDMRVGIAPMGWAYVVGLGVFPTVLAFLSWGWALKNAPKVTYVTNFMFVTPFLATIFGFLLANELPGIETFFGGALILTGLAIFNFHGVMWQWISSGFVKK